MENSVVLKNCQSLTMAGVSSSQYILRCLSISLFAGRIGKNQTPPGMNATNSLIEKIRAWEIWNDQLNNVWETVKIPLVLSVTGHRDLNLEDSEAVKKEITDYLQNEVIEKYKSSPVRFLSALAEGADRLAAQVAIDCRCELGVILPFEQEEYEKDFKSPESLAEFRQLLAMASFVEVVKRPQSPPAGGDRADAYFEVGLELLRHAQVLIAIWDGDETRTRGGTADVVHLAMNGVPIPGEAFEDSIAYPDVVPVAHFPVRRCNSSATRRPAKYQITATNIWREIDSFNQAVARFAEEGRIKKIGSPFQVGYLASDLAGECDEGDPKTRRLAALYGCADALSQNAQKIRLRYFWQILVLGVLAALLGQLYSGPLMYPWMLAAGIVFALIGTWRWFRLDQQRLENRYLDYRALAEACRVAFFWHVSGIKACPADHYLRDQNEDMDWLRRALRAIDLPHSLLNTNQSGEKSRPCDLRIAERDWIAHQKEYFSKSVIRHSQESAIIGLRAGLFYKAALAVVSLTLALHFIATLIASDSIIDLLPSMTVVYGMLFVLSGLHQIYDSVKANQEHANSYRKMETYFTQAAEKLTPLLQREEHAAAQRLLLTLGKQALKENADWLLLHRQRPVEKITGN